MLHGMTCRHNVELCWIQGDSFSTDYEARFTLDVTTDVDVQSVTNLCCYSHIELLLFIVFARENKILLSQYNQTNIARLCQSRLVENGQLECQHGTEVDSHKAEVIRKWRRWRMWNVNC